MSEIILEKKSIVSKNPAVVLKHQAFDLNTNRLCSESEQWAQIMYKSLFLFFLDTFLSLYCAGKERKVSQKKEYWRYPKNTVNF